LATRKKAQKSVEDFEMKGLGDSDKVLGTVGRGGEGPGKADKELSELWRGEHVKG
jgi:hypothetical protein